MGILKLTANPTFKATVAVPVAGEDSVDVKFTFKHRTKTDMDAFMASRENVPDIDTFMEMVVGWELPEDFNRENALILLENHIGAALSAYRTYIDELYKSKLGN